MKSTLLFCWRVSAVVGLAVLAQAPGSASAQTNENTSSTTEGVTDITSKAGRFDFNTRSLVYTENVHVVDPRVDLTCEYMIAKFPTNGERRVESAVAETNVVALITTNDVTYRITAAKAIYTFQPIGVTTNQTLELVGFPPPVIRWASDEQTPAKTNIFTARRILWDFIKNQITADDQHGTFPDLANPVRRKKAEATTTNATTEPKPAEPKPATP